MVVVLCPGRCPSLCRLCPYRAFSLRKATVLCSLYSKNYLNIYALCLSGAEGGEDAEHDANKDAHEHADESVEKEADVGAEIEPEDNGLAREESDECGHSAHALDHLTSFNKVQCSGPTQAKEARLWSRAQASVCF